MLRDLVRHVWHPLGVTATTLPTWAAWFQIAAPLVVALVALGGVLYSNARTTANIEKAADAARESKRTERHEDRVHDSYTRIEVARAALERVLSDTLYDQSAQEFRPEVPGNQDSIRQHLELLLDAHAHGSLHVSKDVDRLVGSARPPVNEAARVTDSFEGADDERRRDIVRDKVMDAIHALSRLRIQMRIELGTSKPEDMY